MTHTRARRKATYKHEPILANVWVAAGIACLFLGVLQLHEPVETEVSPDFDTLATGDSMAAWKSDYPVIEIPTISTLADLAEVKTPPITDGVIAHTELVKADRTQSDSVLWINDDDLITAWIYPKTMTLEELCQEFVE